VAVGKSCPHGMAGLWARGRGEEGAAGARTARGAGAPMAHPTAGHTVALPAGERSGWNSLGSFVVSLGHLYDAVPGTHLGNLCLKRVWYSGCTWG